MPFASQGHEQVSRLDPPRIVGHAGDLEVALVDFDRQSFDQFGSPHLSSDHQDLAPSQISTAPSTRSRGWPGGGAWVCTNPLPLSFGLSGFYYDRFFIDWDEQRIGGRASLGWTFPERPDLSANFSLRYEQIDIFNPRAPTPQALQEVVGSNDLMWRRGSAGILADARETVELLPHATFVSQLNGPGARPAALNEIFEHGRRTKDHRLFNIWNWPSGRGALAADRIHPSDVGYRHMVELAWTPIAKGLGL